MGNNLLKGDAKSGIPAELFAWIRYALEHGHPPEELAERLGHMIDLVVGDIADEKRTEGQAWRHGHRTGKRLLKRS